MLIGGLQKFSLIDYPDKISCIVFTQGCNFCCSYCYNAELVYSYLFKEPLPIDGIFKFLETRVGKLDGVVITGGEPTIQPDLIDFVRTIKDMEYLVKLDTNGSRPQVIKKLLDLKLLDYIAMDIKAPLNKYQSVVGVQVVLDDIKDSINTIENSGVDYEFRTVFDKTLFEDRDKIEIQLMVSNNSDVKFRKLVKPII